MIAKTSITFGSKTNLVGSAYALEGSLTPQTNIVQNCSSTSCQNIITTGRCCITNGNLAGSCIITTQMDCILQNGTCI